MAKPASFDILLGALDGALARVAARDDNPVPPDLVPTISAAVVAEAAQDPALQHVTNSEPWYASRVTWGAIIAALAPVVGLALGRTITVADQASIVEIGTAVGTLAGAGLSLYGAGWRRARSAPDRNVARGDCRGERGALPIQWAFI